MTQLPAVSSALQYFTRAVPGKPPRFGDGGPHAALVTASPAVPPKDKPPAKPDDPAASLPKLDLFVMIRAQAGSWALEVPYIEAGETPPDGLDHWCSSVRCEP
jgi:hypothetical protein